MHDFEQALTFEIAVLQAQLEQAQINVTSLKRRIRGLSKHLEEITAPHEPFTDMENCNDC